MCHSLTEPRRQTTNAQSIARVKLVLRSARLALGRGVHVHISAHTCWKWIQGAGVTRQVNECNSVHAVLCCYESTKNREKTIDLLWLP